EKVVELHLDKAAYGRDEWLQVLLDQWTARRAARLCLDIETGQHESQYRAIRMRALGANENISSSPKSQFGNQYTATAVVEDVSASGVRSQNDATRKRVSQ
ncbi:MAG: hypothetical protein ABFC96_10700, partial [Thermoguttaceae bacterium]